MGHKELKNEMQWNHGMRAAWIWKGTFKHPFKNGWSGYEEMKVEMNE